MTKVWLADLTHTGQTIASDAVPAAIGMIAEFLESQCKHLTEVRIFKYPDELGDALLVDTPSLIGFSNYIWNFRLAQMFGREIKARYPHVISVMGGPNFPTDEREQKEFLGANRWLDYYIVKEAELAFSLLIAQLSTDKWNKEVTSLEEVPNLVYLSRDKLVRSKQVKRVMDLSSIPSPYLSGRLNDYLDGRLMPVIQTNRGCPFTCAFCTEGQNYWNKVRKKPSSVIKGEIEWIANAMSQQPKERRRGDLLIADSNFGMFKEDLETCEVIGKVQGTHDYPTYINVATGKNRKERVLEAARLVNGAMKLAGSVQSLDPTVQANMKRANISADQIVDLALQASDIGTNTYSEVILALPGDTKQAHFDTLKTLVEADFSTISMYQLMVLPGTEFGEEKVKKRHKMLIRYRVIPRAFGSYRLYEKTHNVAEIESICVQNETLSYADYLECRRLNLIVNIFFNDRVFGETLKIWRGNSLSVFDLLVLISNSRHSQRFENFVEGFLADTESELWDNIGALEDHISEPENMARAISGEFGSNLIFKYKALSLTAYFDDICVVLEESIERFLDGLAEESSFEALRPILMESIEFKRLQIGGMFSDFGTRVGKFHFSENLLTPNRRDKNTDGSMRETARLIEFNYSEKQLANMKAYLDVFGDSMPGLTRILSRARVTEYFRIAKLVD